MNREDIIRMAREAGFEVYETDVWITDGWWLEELERFAALVAAAEREKLAAWMMRQGYATGHGDTTEDLLRELEWQIEERVRNEREACAAAERERLCKAIKEEDDYCVTEGDYMLDSDDCIAVAKGEWVRPDYSADAIRARGNT